MKPDADTLRTLYLTEKLSASAIARQYGVQKISALRWLRSAGIQRRPIGNGLANRGDVIPDRDTLYQMVYVNHWGYRQIAAHYGIAFTAVPHWLDRFAIPRPTVWETRRKGRTVILPTPDELRVLYEQGATLAAIADQYGVSRATISQMCHRAGIILRPDGWENGKRLLCPDGHAVRSRYEQRVDLWLCAHGVAHTYEPQLPFDHRYHADFLANGWYIEIWGVTDSADYTARKTRKRLLYQHHAAPLLELSHYDFRAARQGRIGRVLRRCLTPALF